MKRGTKAVLIGACVAGVGTSVAQVILYETEGDYTGDIEMVGESTGPGEWKSVTNRTSAGTATKFIGVEVNQN